MRRSILTTLHAEKPLPITLESVDAKVDALITDFREHEKRQTKRDDAQDAAIREAANLAAKGAVRKAGVWGSAAVFLVSTADQWLPPLGEFIASLLR